MGAARRQTIIQGAVARFDALGSQEIARHLGFALDRSAMKARDRFRVSMRQVLGRSPTGARALLGGVALSAYTVNAVNYRPIAFRDGMTADDLSTEVFVNASQGTRGRDQSAFLKFQFGDGPQTREPGDVGMSDDQVNIPRAEALVLTQHLEGVTSGGRQRRGLLALLAARAHVKGTDVWEALNGIRPVTRSEVMAQVGREARSIHLMRGRAEPPRVTLQTSLDRARERYGDVALRRRVEAARSRQGVAAAIKAGIGLAEQHNAAPWGVFRAPDRESGLPTFFARPMRIVDPSGGYKTFVRRDGTTAKMPRMLAVSPEYGAQGAAAGPRALVTARPKVTYDPKLQAPWELMAELADEDLAQALADEYAHALERMEQGRSY